MKGHCAALAARVMTINEAIPLFRGLLGNGASVTSTALYINLFETELFFSVLAAREEKVGYGDRTVMGSGREGNVYNHPSDQGRCLGTLDEQLKNEAT